MPLAQLHSCDRQGEGGVSPVFIRAGDGQAVAVELLKMHPSVESGSFASDTNVD